MPLAIIDGQKFNTLQELLEYAKNHPEKVDELRTHVYGFDLIWREYLALQDYDHGDSSAQDLLRFYGENPGTTLTPESEKWLDNQIARENTEQQQNYELNARDTSLLSSGSQLQQLGLSPSNVVQVGGASAGVQGSTADTAMRSNSALHQQAKINKYNQQMGLAKSLIGAASSMASSGIYGAALGAVKHGASQIAGAAAHSGLQALQATKSPSYAKYLEREKFPVTKDGLLDLGAL